MSEPVRALHLSGEAQHRHEGEALLRRPGDAVLVNRGVLRSILIACPDGCGQTLAVNLDPRAGPAWKIYRNPDSITLYPSVWRDGGCGSHFIVWRNHIIWCDRFAAGNREPAHDRALEERVLRALDPNVLRAASDVAAQLDEIPWDVSRAARILVSRGLAIAGTGRQTDMFRRAATPTRDPSPPSEADRDAAQPALLRRLWSGLLGHDI